MLTSKNFSICKRKFIIHGFLMVTYFLGVLGKEIPKNGTFAPVFGHSMRAEFLMNPGFIQVDHGSFGTMPRAVAKALQNIRVDTEAHPGLFYRSLQSTALSKIRKLLARLMNWDDPEDIVMIPNASTGLSSILRSLNFQPKDRILYLSTSFKGAIGLINFIIDSHNGTISGLEFPVELPMSNEDILKSFDRFLMTEVKNPAGNIRIAVIDHISSMPSLIWPLSGILKILRQHNIMILVDGAHAIGQVPIDLKSLKPDFYITDCHKWLFAARSCGVMYVDKRHQGWVHPPTISYNYRNPADFQYEFGWQGTYDVSPYLTVEHALNFRNSAGGEEAIQRYNHELCWIAGQHVTDYFRANFKNQSKSIVIIQIQQEKSQIGSMVDVRLPIGDPEKLRIHGSSKWWDDLQFLRYSNVTYAPVYKFRGYLYVRLSCQIYNDISDYEKVAEHFLKICQEINAE